MNNRWKELAEQCMDRRLDGLHFDKEMFAGLIVRECLLVLEPNLYESDIEYRVDQAFYKRCERIIKQHFEIE